MGSEIFDPFFWGLGKLKNLGIGTVLQLERQPKTLLVAIHSTAYWLIIHGTSIYLTFSKDFLFIFCLKNHAMERKKSILCLIILRTL